MPAPTPQTSPEIVIDSLEFQNQSTIPQALQQNIREAIEKNSFTANAEPNWADQVGEVARDEAQKIGYFKVLVDAGSGLIRAEPRRLHYWVSLEIGLDRQFRLGQVRFEQVSVFDEATLRSLIPIQQGELFSVAKVREGLDNLRRLYVKVGYIDFTAEPQEQIDENALRIDLTLRLSLDKQYRVRSLEIRGFNQISEQQLQSKFEIGQIFDGTAIHEFFKANSASSLQGISEQNSVMVARHREDATVSIVFEQRRCQPPK